MSRPKPGVCGKCGHATVRLNEKHAMGPPPKDYSGTLDGHTYEKGRLKKVRCLTCEPQAPQIC